MFKRNRAPRNQVEKTISRMLIRGEQHMHKAAVIGTARKPVHNGEVINKLLTPQRSLHITLLFHPQPVSECGDNFYRPGLRQAFL